MAKQIQIQAFSHAGSVAIVALMDNGNIMERSRDTEQKWRLVHIQQEGEKTPERPGGRTLHDHEIRIMKIEQDLAAFEERLPHPGWMGWAADIKKRLDALEGRAPNPNSPIHAEFCCPLCFGTPLYFSKSFQGRAEFIKHWEAAGHAK